MTTITQQQTTDQASSTESLDQIAWQRACALAADRLSATTDAGRLARGLALAQSHRVTMTLSDEVEDYAHITSGKKTYTITQAGACPCDDYVKGQKACKHLIALSIHQSAPTFFDHQQAEVAVEQEAAQAECPPIIPIIQVDNPAGFNWKARVGGSELWYTFHDTSDEALLARLQTMIPRLQKMALDCEAQAKMLAAQEKEQAHPQAPLTVDAHLATLVAEAVQKALKGAGFPASTTNGMKPKEPIDGNDTDASWCPHHGIQMDYHPANDRGPAWYSHRLGSGGYCRGSN